MTDTFARLAAESASPLDTVYIADTNLDHVWSDTNWSRFASNNGGAALLEEGWPGHLLDQFSGTARNRWEQIYGALLDGSLQSHSEEIPCPSPTLRRFYTLHVRKMEATSGAPILMHRLTPADPQSAKATLTELCTTLSRLPTPDFLEAYRSLVGRQTVEIAGNEVARYVHPLEGMGGDFVWTFTYESGAIDLLIGDAMGHGDAAAKTALWCIACFAAESTIERPLPELVERVNRTFFQSGSNLDEGSYATGIVMRYVKGHNHLHALSFGHNNPILSETGILMLTGGLPIGLIDSSTGCSESRIDFDVHGRSLLTYTDGITEQFDAAGTMYGEDRLEELFQRSVHLPMDALLRRITDDVHAFSGDTMQKDDQTILGVRFRL